MSGHVAQGWAPTEDVLLRVDGDRVLLYADDGCAGPATLRIHEVKQLIVHLQEVLEVADYSRARKWAINNKGEDQR